MAIREHCTVHRIFKISLLNCDSAVQICQNISTVIDPKTLFYNISSDTFFVKTQIFFISVSEVSQKCLRSVSKVSQKYLRSVSEVSPQFLNTVSTLSQHCLSTVSILSQHCLSTVSELIIKL